jgi:hypothetical protein
MQRHGIWRLTQIELSERVIASQQSAPFLSSNMESACGVRSMTRSASL